MKCENPSDRLNGVPMGTVGPPGVAFVAQAGGLTDKKHTAGRTCSIVLSAASLLSVRPRTITYCWDGFQSVRPTFA